MTSPAISVNPQQVVKAVLRMADMFEKCFVAVMMM